MKFPWDKTHCWSESKDRLSFKGRSAIPDFSDQEQLFFRFESPPVNNNVAVSDIRYPDAKGTSCNRSGDIESAADAPYCGSISHPQDVLFPFFYGSGVSAFCVSHLRRVFESAGGVKIEVRAVHTPTLVRKGEPGEEYENYAHSSLFNYNEGSQELRKSIPKTVKFRVRLLISENTVVLKSPE